MLMTFMQGFGMGGSLILAIGAQNAFVLSQGVRRNHHIIVALICGFSDAVLVTAGVTGVGRAMAADPVLKTIAAWGGAAFLIYYGFGAFRSSFKGGRLESDDRGRGTLGAVVLATLAVTFLNPHVYLDTVLMLGGISSRFPEGERYFFGFGAISASFVWFFALSLGGRLLAPVFRKPIAWRILDGLVCLTMWIIAASLIRNAIAG